MIFGLPLAHFLRLWLSIIGVITIVVLLPFVIRRFWSQSYRGFWQVAGDVFLRSPRRALMHPLGMLLGLAALVLVFYRPVAILDQPTQPASTPTATLACLSWESRVVCQDRLKAEKLPLPPPGRVSSEFQTSEAQYLLVLTQQALTPQPPPATPEPILLPGTLIREEGDKWVYRGASAYQPHPLFEVSFEESAWRLDGTRLISHAIDGCELELFALGGGMLEAPSVTHTKLGDFDAEVRVFREAAFVSYGVGIGNYYYLFGLDLPKDAAEAADSCQLAGERVLSTFRLANSRQ